VLTRLAWPLAAGAARADLAGTEDRMLEVSDVIAFAAATDLDRSREFYQGTLGLRLVEQNPYACVFDVRGTMLRVTAVAEVATPGYTVLGWRVDDIDEVIAGLSAKGVTFSRYEGMDQAGNGVWTTPAGDRIAWFTDPDGNTLSLTQFT
jgi:catechol 2,3-dioxygenase-like lactoylglutathione lyase family enzyme